MGISNTERGHCKKVAVIQKPLLAAAAVLFPLPLWAALPTPVAPSTAPAAGDWIGLIQGYIKDGGLVLGLAIAVLGFLWIAFDSEKRGWHDWLAGTYVVKGECE